MKKSLIVTCVLFFLIVPSALAKGQLIAPPEVCPGNSTMTMYCLVDYARGGELLYNESLRNSAAHKDQDIASCGFSHTACDRPFSYWIKIEGGMCDEDGQWHVGENLAWGEGKLGSAREIFRAWMASPTHRSNILDPSWTDTGISRLQVDGVAYWAEHFSDC